MVLLAFAGYRLGTALFSRPAGVLLAAILATRPELVELALYGSFDVPFLAFVLLAAAVEVERPRRTVAPLVLLALAGLLRPEAWLIAAAYALYVAVPGPRRVLPLALAAAGPVLWLAHDLILTGDAFFSLHGTRDVAELSQPGNGLDEALLNAPSYVNELTGAVVAIGGVLAWLLVPAALQRR